MADKKLESFKAADRQKKRVSAPTAAPEGGREAATTMGFARIEGILDSEAPGAVADALQALLQSLVDREAAATTPKERAACRRARAAVERTMDLLAHLFRTKAALQAATVAGGAGAGAGKGNG